MLVSLHKLMLQFSTLTKVSLEDTCTGNAKEKMQYLKTLPPPNLFKAEKHLAFIL